jgi:murein DD-endopeptidase MepM/ murein hydrolase activator NlpD
MTNPIIDGKTQQLLSAVRAHVGRVRALRLQHSSKLRVAVLISVVAVFGAVTAFGIAPLTPDPADIPVTLVHEELSVPPLAQQLDAMDAQNQDFVHEERIRRGDTLGTLLARLQVSDPNAEQFIRTDVHARAMYQLRPGRIIQARTDDNGSLLSLRYLHTPADDATDASANPSSRALVVERQRAGFLARDEYVSDDRHVEMRSGTIVTSLFGATDAAGIPEAVATQIADVFSGDIDFYRGMRRGDRFRVVYEMYYQGGEVARSGRVLAVEFINAGKSHQAMWYQAPGQAGGYYGPDGASLRRAFLRVPLQFTRVSSGFGGRVHPILNTWRWHTGIDYAAPIGTPVHSTADGIVEFVGKQNGYGNAIQIKHQGVYSTLYGHLSAFASGLHKGQRVEQGQLIGYVGMTGWATGPHLHYEFRIDGVAHDPMHVVMPESVPIAPAQIAGFRTATAQSRQQIGLLRDIDQVASASS